MVRIIASPSTHHHNRMRFSLLPRARARMCYPLRLKVRTPLHRLHRARQLTRLVGDSNRHSEVGRIVCHSAAFSRSFDLT